jgi:hypothetical protein
MEPITENYYPEARTTDVDLRLCKKKSIFINQTPRNLLLAYTDAQQSIQHYGKKKSKEKRQIEERFSKTK